MSGSKFFNVNRLFSLFDISGDGKIDMLEFVGLSSEAIGQAEWEGLPTAQKWRLYCKRTAPHTFSLDWSKMGKSIISPESIDVRFDMEDKRDREKAKMKEL